MSFLSALPEHGPARNAAVAAAITAGRIDPPTWVRVTCGRVEVEVSADWLTIEGNRIPMTAENAQRAVDGLDASLPTPAIVDAIEAAASKGGRFVPFKAWPHWQDDSQLATSTIQWRERNIAEANVPPGVLLAGCLKDVVLAPFMPAGRVVIYGAGGVQPLYPVKGGAVGHGAYFDGGYSHAVRCVRRRCWLDGVQTTLEAVLAAGHCGGPVATTRYPTTAISSPTTPSSRVLRRGMTGEDVRVLQALLGIDADGLFGEKTEMAVRSFQKTHPPLVADGVAGPKTLAALTASDALPTVPPVLSDAEVDALFGPLRWVHAPTTAEPSAIRITNAWQKDNLRRVVIPQLVGIEGAPKDGAIFLHRLIVEQTRALWAAWEAAGLLPLVLSWAGSWNPRMVRGGSTLSRHAYAIGFDINAAQNPLGKPPAPRGAKGSVVELVPLAVEHGFSWGGVWQRPDGMHVESFKVL